MVMKYIPEVKLLPLSFIPFQVYSFKPKLDGILFFVKTSCPDKLNIFMLKSFELSSVNLIVVEGLNGFG